MTREIPETTSARIQCGFIGVDNGITGFAWDRRKPDKALEVEIVLAGEPLGTTRADISDPALAARGESNAAAHIFRFRLSRIPSLPCEIVGRVSGMRDTFGPLRIETTNELANAVELSLRYEGQIEELVRGKGRIQGWVIDRFNPIARVRVTLRDWEEPLMAVRADIYRAGLEQAGKGDGRCAFAIHLPADLLDDQEHTLRVTVEETNFAIPGCPIVFRPEIARELLEVIAPWREDFLHIEWILHRLDELADLQRSVRGGRLRSTAMTKLVDELRDSTKAVRHLRMKAVSNFSDAFVLSSKKHR